MPENNPFPSVEQEAKRAADELLEMKTLVKSLLAKIDLVEKRLAALAPGAQKKTAVKSMGQPVEQTTGGPAEIFKQMLEKYKSAPRSVEEELAELKKDQLAAIATYTGFTVTSKSNKKDLSAAITSRLRESKIMSGGIG